VVRGGGRYGAAYRQGVGAGRPTRQFWSVEQAGFRDVAHRDQLNELTLVILLTSMWGFVGANRAGIGFVLPALLPEFQLEF